MWFPKATGRFPLILFSHGLTASPAGYADLLTAWARAGFVVAAPAYPHTAAGVPEFNPLDVLNQPADASYVITERWPGSAQRAGRPGGGGRPLRRRGHHARPVHRQPGRAAARRRGAGRPPGPDSPFLGAPAPLLFVHGKRDETVTYADGRAAYNAVPWPKAFLTVTRGRHLSTGDELDVVAATSTEFWRWSLYGDAAAKERLPLDAKRGGLATLTSHW